jgi:hypothetical protein
MNDCFFYTVVLKTRPEYIYDTGICTNIKCLKNRPDQQPCMLVLIFCCSDQNSLNQTFAPKKKKRAATGVGNIETYPSSFVTINSEPSDLFLFYSITSVYHSILEWVHCPRQLRFLSSMVSFGILSSNENSLLKFYFNICLLVLLLLKKVRIETSNQEGEQALWVITMVHSVIQWTCLRSRWDKHTICQWLEVHPLKNPHSVHNVWNLLLCIVWISWSGRCRPLPFW